MSIRSLSVNDLGDLVVGDGSNLSVATGIDAVVQDVTQATRKILGENQFNTSEGIDYFGTVFSPTPDYDQFRFQLEDAAMTVPDVIEVVSIDISKNGNDVSYTMQINTAYGSASISSTVQS